MTFCNDVDLLHWEPNIFQDAAFASQMLIKGTGDLSGTTFTLDSGSLSDAQVAAGGVIALTGTIEGAYPIVSVDSATQLTLSVLYDALYPDSGEGEPVPVGTAADLNFTIRTFSPQAKMVSRMLKTAAGIVPGTEDEDSIVILNPETMRRACVLGTLQMIYSALAAVATEPANYSVRADLYERLFRRALRGVRVELDTNGDGQRDVRRSLGVLELYRS
jgi:hypothetical protein